MNPNNTTNSGEENMEYVIVPHQEGLPETLSDDENDYQSSDEEYEDFYDKPMSEEEMEDGMDEDEEEGEDEDLDEDEEISNFFGGRSREEIIGMLGLRSSSMPPPGTIIY